MSDCLDPLTVYMYLLLKFEAWLVALLERLGDKIFLFGLNQKKIYIFLVSVGNALF